MSDEKRTVKDALGLRENIQGETSLKGRPHPEAGLQISLEKMCLVLLVGEEVLWVAQARAGPQLLGRQEATPQGECKLRLVGGWAEGVRAPLQARSMQSHIGRATRRWSLGLHCLQETACSEQTVRTEHHCPKVPHH